jgi:hypothetical protein
VGNRFVSTSKTEALRSDVQVVSINVIKEKPQAMKKIGRFALATLALLTLLPRLILGYLDPGSGSMLLQVLLGGVVGLIVIVKLYWNNILSLLHIRKAAPKESELEANETPRASE